MPSQISPERDSNKTMASEDENLNFLEFENIFDKIGSFGRYQIFVAICIQYSCIMLAGNFYMMSFGTLKPEWRCRAEDMNETKDYCQFLDNCTDLNGTSLLEVQSEFYSIVEHWKLVCQNDYVPNFMISIQMIGQALGNPIGGHLADYFGRKWISFIGFVCFLCSGLLCSVAPNWQILTVFMFLLGLSFGLYIASMFVLVMELSGRKYRLIMNCCFQWCLAFQVAALVAYLTRDWRTYMVGINCICLPLAIMMIFIDESPRWLIQRRKFETAAGVLNKIAKWNKRKTVITSQMLKNIQLDERRSTYSVFMLFSTKKLFLYSLICIMTAFFCACVIGVILFNVGSLAGSPFLNVALYGLLRIWTPPLLILMELKSTFFGRRPMYLCSMIFVIACFIGIIVINILALNASIWHTIATALSLVGSCINAGVLDVATTQYMTELFPTVVRAIAVGTFNVMDNLGSVTAPQLLYLQKYWSPLPYVAVASLGALAWVLGYFVLPETAGKPLPDTMTETKNIEMEDRHGPSDTI